MATNPSVEKDTKPPQEEEPSSANAETQSPNPDPDTKCSICLKDKKYEAFVKPCKHSFCFICIQNWGNTKMRKCPICKKILRAVLHDVKASPEPCVHPYVPSKQPRKPEDDYEILPDELEIPHLPLLMAGKSDEAGSRRPSLYVLNRRKIYLEDLFAVETYPDTVINPRFFVENPGEYERVSAWVYRELKAIYLNHEKRIRITCACVCSTLLDTSLMSKKFRSGLRHNLGKLTRHFQHELNCFAASRLPIEEYAKVVTYKSVPINRGKYKSNSKKDAVDILIPRSIFENPFCSKQKDKIVYSDSDESSADQITTEESWDNYMPYEEDTSEYKGIDFLLPIGTRRFSLFSKAQGVTDCHMIAYQANPVDFDCLMNDGESTQGAKSADTK